MSEMGELKKGKIEHYRDSSINNLHFWDRLEKHENLKILAKLARLAETLPTSSATIEQSFSNVKLLKTDIRNRLNEASLEGLFLVGQEFREKNKLTVTPQMITLYRKVHEEFNAGKKIKSVEAESDKMNEETKSGESSSIQKKVVKNNNIVKETSQTKQTINDTTSENKVMGTNDSISTPSSIGELRQALNPKELLWDDELYPLEKKVKFEQDSREINSSK